MSRHETVTKLLRNRQNYYETAEWCRAVSGGLGANCNYTCIVITAVITVITTALFQLPVIGQDKPSVRVPSPADTRAAARQSHLQGHVTEEMALTAPR